VPRGLKALEFRAGQPDPAHMRGEVDDRGDVDYADAGFEPDALERSIYDFHSQDLAEADPIGQVNTP
jgi:hypothetical protein